MIVLGIETSCDETAVGIAKDGKKILSNAVSSSVHLHSRYGGVVPEIATRFHVEYINYVLKKALIQAKVNLKDIELIAVTCGPGLIGALLIGISQAKALSYALKRPIVGVNHLKAHIWAPLMQETSVKFPFVALIVSGGHTSLVYVQALQKIRLLGNTKDDAAGEAFDKVAGILNIGYPGGPIIERLARDGDAYSIRFPRAYIDEESLDFSFSGIKTAVLYYVKRHALCALRSTSKRTTHNAQRTTHIADICASFQEAVIETLIYKSLLACRKKRTSRLVIGGGVSANARLREAFKKAADLNGINIFFPPKDLSIDNAAMIAGLGYQEFKSKRYINRLQAYSNMNLEG